MAVTVSTCCEPNTYRRPPRSRHRLTFLQGVREAIGRDTFWRTFMHLL